MGRLKFVETIKHQEYVVMAKGKKVYLVRRDPLLWQAFDCAGEKIGLPDRYRNDIFERLEIIHNAKP